MTAGFSRAINKLTLVSRERQEYVGMDLVGCTQQHLLAVIVVSLIGAILGGTVPFAAGTVVTEMYINGKTRNVTSVWAVVYASVSLACDLSPPHPEDRPNLVLWYRGTSLEPIYSFDARGVPFERGTPWTDDSRNSFRAVLNVGRLQINNVTAADGGIYRCRVDYQRAPATDYFFNISLIVPPPVPAIVDSLGPIVSSVSGIFKEGDTLRLSCSVSEGWPVPTLTWKVDGLVADSIQLVAPSGYPRSDLVIPSLTREDLHKTLSCEAANDNATAPSTRHVSIDMNLPPIDVRIRSLVDGPLIAGQAHQFACETIGSRPPPRIRWWLGSKHLRSDRETTSNDGNISTSYLALTPAVTDNGEILTCQADNKYLDQGSTTAEHEVRLSVHYKPIVKLKFGRNVDSRTIAVNHDVYLECFIDANPKVRNVEWNHEGDVVRRDPLNGVILANHTLVLQRIQRRSSGIYVCSATNDLGSTKSNTLFVQVKHPPSCAGGRGETRIVVSLGEVANVTCRVDGDPMRGMSFSWVLMNSTTPGPPDGPSSPVPPELVDDSRADQGVSLVVFRASKVGDFGTLSCSARNSIGAQSVPCLFHLVRGEKPGQLRNCTVLLPSPSTVAIGCDPGPDGGMPPTFHLEVYSSSSSLGAAAESSGSYYWYTRRKEVRSDDATAAAGHRPSTGLSSSSLGPVPAGSLLLLVANLTSPTPEFEIKGLLASSSSRGQREYVCLVYASNAKGSSYTLSFGIKLDDVQWKDSAVKSNKNRPPSILLSSALGSLGTGIVLAIGCYCFAAKCYNRRKVSSRAPEARTWVARDHHQRLMGSMQAEMSDRYMEVPIGRRQLLGDPPTCSTTSYSAKPLIGPCLGASSNASSSGKLMANNEGGSIWPTRPLFVNGVSRPDDEEASAAATILFPSPSPALLVPAVRPDTLVNGTGAARSSRRAVMTQQDHEDEASYAAHQHCAGRNSGCITIVTTPQPLLSMHDVESIV